MGEVIYTLIDNAAKYSPPETRIRVSASADNDGTVKLVIEDEGPGVPVALREQVFDKFFRAMHEGDRGKPAGTGMGLAIAQGIVEAHGGRIWIEDGSEGRGARFVVALPTNAEA